MLEEDLIGDNPEDDPEIVAIEAVKFNDFNNYLAEKDAERPCEACGHKEWCIKTQEDDYPALHFLTNYRKPSTGTLFFSTFCPRCGNTRLFDALEVVAHLGWVDEQNG